MEFDDANTFQDKLLTEHEADLDDMLLGDNIMN